MLKKRERVISNVDILFIYNKNFELRSDNENNVITFIFRRSFSNIYSIRSLFLNN